MSHRGAARIEVTLLTAAVLGGILLVASGSGAPAAGRGGPPGSWPTVTSMGSSSTNADVRHLPQLPNTANRDAAEEHDGPRQAVQGGQQFAEIGSGTSVGPSIPAPSTLTSFEGLAYNEQCNGTQCGDGHPPDTNGDVGPTYYIQTINTAVGIYDKSSGARVAAFTFNALMSQGSFGNLCDTDNFGDPVVLYDTFADRWVITDFAFQVDGGGNVVNPPGAFQCIAVSQSGDPVSGGWYFYSVQITDGLQDYPKLGIWPDGIYMSANLFPFAAGGAFKNVRVWAFDKARMYAGLSAQAVSFDVAKVQGCTPFTLLPANARRAAGTPPAGRANPFVSVWCTTNSLQVWQFHADWTTPANSTFTGPTSSATGSSWAVGPPGVPALNGNDLDTLYIRLMAQNQYTNIGGVESIWPTHTVAGSSASQSAIRWYQVPVTGGTVGAALQASTFNPDTNHRLMPSIAVDRMGDMALGYSVTSATMYPAIRYAGRLAGDPVGTITQTETALINGTGAQSGNCGGAPCDRWGDYSAMTLDPNGCTFWYTNEYYPDLSLNHHTRIGSFRYPGCTDGVPPTAPPPTATPIPPTPTPPSPTGTPIPPDNTPPALTTPGLSPNPVIPGATVTVSATATDATAVASAQKQLNGGAWTSMNPVDGAFGGTSEAVTSAITAPATAGTYQVCVRATDSHANTSNGLACSTLTVMSYSLSPATATASTQQGKPAAWTINIARSSFPASVDLSVSGLPAGASGTFSADPAGGSSSVLTVTTSNCGTPTPRGTFTLTVTGLASGLTRTATVSMTVTNSAPTMTAPLESLYANTTLSTSTARVKTAWSACDADGITKYTLQRQVTGGTWTTVTLASALSTSINQSLTRSTTYRFRAYATDGTSTSAAYVYGPSFQPLVSNDASTLITYSGTWGTGTYSSYYGGTDRYASVAGASATYTFTGKSVAWVAYKSAIRGSAQVFVDGVLKATVNLYATTSTARAQVYAFNWATSGTHTLKIVVVGTAGHPRVDIDAFVRLSLV